MTFIRPGSTQRLSVSFTDAQSAAVDPGTVVVEIKPVAGAIASYTYGVGAEVVKDGTGLYHIDYVVPPISGRSQRFAYRWLGSGNVYAADEGEFLVSTRFF